MTRFARAQGSKSSNERVPLEATSWAEMTQQLAVTKTELNDSEKKTFLDLREKNYKNFLEENTTKQTNTWTDFPDEITSKRASLSIEKTPNTNGKFKNEKSTAVKTKRKLQKNEPQEGSDKQVEDEQNTKISGAKSIRTKDSKQESNVIAKTKKSKTKQLEVVEKSNSTCEVVPKVQKVFADEKEKLIYEKKLARRERQREKLKQRKAILAAGENNRLTQVFKEKEEKRKEKRLQLVLARKADREKLKPLAESTVVKNQIESSEGLTNTQKRTLPKKKKIALISEGSVNVNDKIVLNSADGDTVTEEKADTNVKDKKRKSSEPQLDLNENAQVQKRKKQKRKDAQPNNQGEDLVNKLEINENLKNNNPDIHQRKDRDKFNQNVPNQPQSNTSSKQHKLNNSRWTGEHRRKPRDPDTTILHLNGRSIEIVLFDGFPVRKADYERLAQLRKDMVSKGVPRSEVQRAMQLERRRAEKALAREKKEVCFHCRKAGHKLTECPQALTQETEATGICFKCGSTEHTHFECKVVQQQQYKFATCFICREPGHIAKQCPQNARGIYPQGGCCKVCGDVTHLKKDCPQYQAKQEHNAVYADTIDGANLEALDLEKPEDVIVKAVAKPVKNAKMVKF